MGLQDDLRTYWRTGGALVRIILINIALFLVLHVIDLPFFLAGRQGPDLIAWLKSTSDLHTLLFRPWTVITYMFLHWDLLHIFFNMLVLWFAGRIFQDLLGPKRLLGNYLLGGLLGLFFYVISYNLFPVFERYTAGSTILGASAAVMGVFIGIATYRPDLVVHLFIFGPVRLKYIALIYVVIDLISIRQGANSGGHIAHLGGALYGFLAARQLKNGRDISLGFVNTLERFFDLFQPRKGGRMKVSHRAKARRRSAEGPALNKQARIDHILDKISKSGYDSLTKDEKDILFRASNDS
ncbi:MAG: rhomboid family intramembrane serine protease [Flavobacteriales bacterium]|nr:rhomboid family intramembrane serine protease [Flavobacteriales bacterium]MCB9168659.1 rhomboid family intramembrane serine protease [Flavobacteriales bacterium]